jgi:uncharacterized repeat protein (TIGR03803 family)
MSTIKTFCLIIAVLSLAATSGRAQTFNTLYSFPQGLTGNPQSLLLLSSNTLFGTTQNGYEGDGLVFGVNTDGSGFTNLYNLTGHAFPFDEGLVLSGRTLYGTTYDGGSNGLGEVFSVNTDGSGFTNLYSFSGSDGWFPGAGLLLSGSTLYGTTIYAGTGNYGNVFAVNKNGSGFMNVHTFNGSDGSNPYGPLVLSGSTLYGTTANGGSAAQGTVFAVNPDSSRFTNLYNFSSSVSGMNSDGISPRAGLLLSGSMLFGTTLEGGTNGYGTLFAINTNGSGFTNLHNFTGGTGGAGPRAVLALAGTRLYGTTSDGTVFQINTKWQRLLRNRDLLRPACFGIGGVGKHTLWNDGWRRR